MTGGMVEEIERRIAALEAEARNIRDEVEENGRLIRVILDRLDGEGSGRASRAG